MATSSADTKATTDMSPEALVARIVQLEHQVKGLMDTVTQIHDRLHLDRMGIPKPDSATLEAGQSSQAAPKTATNASDEQTRAMQARREVFLARRDASRAGTTIELPSRSLDVSKAEPYIYSPLKAQSAELRIMALKANSNASAPIECHLSVIDLDNVAQPGHPRYTQQLMSPGPETLFTPLSYTWGSSSDLETIYIDGKSLKVTRALHNALVTFRMINDNYPQRRRKNMLETFWWIDAICINQQDLDEKSQQVALMTRLYRNAKYVHVWLGSDSEDSNLGMRLVRQLGYNPTTFDDIATWKYIRKPGQTHRPAGPGRPAIELPEEPSADTEDEKRANCKALMSIFRRPWFVRVWVRQEIALPGQVVVHCGDETCTWDELMRAASFLTYIADDRYVGCLQSGKSLSHTSMVSCFQAAAALDEVRNATGEGRRYLSFKDLTFHSRDCQSTDPRDKVYAMLPLCNPDEVSIPANYRETPPKAYEAAVSRLLDTSVNFLAACQNPSRENDLPSWVPDFSSPWKAQPLWPYLSRERPLQNYDFRYGLPQVKHDPQKSTLEVLSILLDDIERTHPLRAQAEDPSESIRKLIEEWWSFSQAKRTELISEMVARKVNINEYPFLNSCFDKTVWDSMCLDPKWDMTSRGRVESQNHYRPMQGRTLDEDPVFRRATNLLIYDTSVDDIKADTGMNHFRRMAIGRQLVMSVGGLTCLVPLDASVGDKIAYIKGSSTAYVLRPQADDTWRVVGETYLMCRPNTEDSKHDFTPRMIILT